MISPSGSDSTASDGARRRHVPPGPGSPGSGRYVHLIRVKQIIALQSPLSNDDSTHASLGQHEQSSRMRSKDLPKDVMTWPCPKPIARAPGSGRRLTDPQRPISHQSIKQSRPPSTPAWTLTHPCPSQFVISSLIPHPAPFRSSFAVAIERFLASTPTSSINPLPVNLPSTTLRARSPPATDHVVKPSRPEGDHERAQAPSNARAQRATSGGTRQAAGHEQHRVYQVGHSIDASEAESSIINYCRNTRDPLVCDPPPPR